MRKKSILIVAGETSGDIYASSLIDVLLEMADLEIYAVGGTQTSRRKVHLLYDSTGWAAIGFIEALKRAPRLLFILRNLKKFLSVKRPDLLVLVDYPGFNMRLVKWAKKEGIPTLYYFPPRKFAMNPRDITDAARNIDQVAANFGFTYRVYKEAGANVDFVGHPLIDLAKPSMTREEAINFFKLEPNRPVVGLCPGSRKSEVEILLPLMLESARILLKKRPEFQFIVPVISTGSDEVYGIPKCRLRRQIETSGLSIRLAEGKMYDVMAISEILLISSGTATLEASNIGAPMIIVYQVSSITEIVARLFYKLPRFIGLPNIILGRQAVPEIIQHDLTPESLAKTALDILSSPETLKRQREDLAEVITHLGKSGAHQHVAQLALNLLAHKQPA